MSGSGEVAVSAARQPTFYPLGDQAAVVRFGESDPDAHLAVRSFTRQLDAGGVRRAVDYVSALTTVTVLYDPVESSYAEVVEELQRLSFIPNEAGDAEVREVEIPVCYEPAFGPDLDFVASHAGLSVEQVIEIHCRADYVVDMIGFAPGFPYLGGLDGRIATPRRDSPRDKVSAGSVGIAGKQTGIYPNESPGGWRLIGRTPLRLFSVDRDRPSLLHAGDRVRFESISNKKFDELAGRGER